MFRFEHTVVSAASRDAVFARYADVAGWPAWDHGVDAASLDGPFAAGTTGTITPSGLETLPFTVTWAEPGVGFTDETPFMGHVLRFIHRLEALPGGGTRITHAVEIEGPAAEEIGPNVVGDLPDAMASLALAAARVPAA